MDDTIDGNGSVLPTHTISAAERLKRFQEDDQALAELAEKVHQRAMADDEHANSAGHLDLRLRERRACMWGYDSPQRFDCVLVSQSQQPNRGDRIRATLREFTNRLPPAQQELRHRLQEMSPEAALELLGPPKPVDVSASEDDQLSNK